MVHPSGVSLKVSALRMENHSDLDVGLSWPNKILGSKVCATKAVSKLIYLLVSVS